DSDEIVKLAHEDAVLRYISAARCSTIFGVLIHKQLNFRVSSVQAGSLKKRKKRNLGHVTGLGAVPYNELRDQFDGRTLFTSSATSERHPVSYRNASDTRISMSSLLGCEKTRSTTRVTRDPNFHIHQKQADTTLLDKVEVVSGSRASSSDHSSMPHLPSTNERPVLLDKSTMNRLRLIVFIGMITGALPWFWDNKTLRLRKFGRLLHKFWWVQWTFITIQTVFLFGIQIWMFYGSLQGEIRSYRGVFISLMTIYWYIFALSYRAIVYLYQDEMRQYINTMLAFNQSYVEQYLIHTEGYKQGGMVVINLSIPAVCLQIFTSLALFLIFHAKPWYLYSHVHPKPWYWLIPGSIQDVIVTGSDITIYMLMSWLIVSHTNSVNFWLKEIHNNNDSDYTTDELRHPKKAIETFRCLQILTTLFNECMSTLGMPLLKLTIILGLVICGFVIVRSMNHLFVDEMPSILLYPIGIINCAANGFG
ncbi:hypothetical protein Ocin01_20227, partial [Orchesella cincta]